MNHEYEIYSVENIVDNEVVSLVTYRRLIMVIILKCIEVSN